MAADERMSVMDIMDGVLCHSDISENLITITGLLFRNNANAIIVREGGVPKGIITSKDILKALFHSDKEPDKILAYEIMSSPIVGIEHDEDITSARNIMINSGMRKLPVRKGIDIVGLLIQQDMLKDLKWHKD